MRFLIVIASFIFSFIAINAAFADSARVAVVRNQNYPPYSWWDESQQKLFGFKRSIADKLLAELNIDVVEVDIDVPNTHDYAYVIENLKNGNINFVLTSKDVAKELSFLHILDTTVAFIQFRVFVLKDRGFHFQQWSDLKNKRGLVQGYPNEPVSTTRTFDSYAQNELNIKQLSSLPAMLSALERGEADYLIGVYRPTLIGLRMLNKQDAIMALDTPVASIGLHWVIPKNSPLVKRADDINALLKQYKEQGLLDFIMNESMQRYIINTQ